MIVVVTGYPSSGKSTVSEIIENRIDDSIEIRTGEVTRKAFKKKHNRPPSNSDELGNWITNKMDEDNLYFAREMTDCIRNTEENTIILGGLRRKDEFNEIIENTSEDFIIVHVHTNFDKRLERIKARDRDGEGDFNEEKLNERDEREKEWGVDKMIESSDYTIYNNKSLSSLESEVEKFIEKKIS